MVKFGKDIFGKGFDLKAEVTNGKCPVCEAPTILVSLYKNFYNLSFDADECITVTNGATQGIYLSIKAMKLIRR